MVEEGADGDGERVREDLEIPGDVNGRRKHFQNEGNRRNFQWEAGRVYWADFGNPYLSFHGNYFFLFLLFFFLFLRCGS